MNLYGWENFWKNQTNSFHEVMKISTSYFAAQLETKLGLNAGVEIFDYGCGPGFLADSLKTKQIRVTGADINQLFIEECKKKHPGSLFILITTDPQSNQPILDRHFNAKTFDFIVLLSIVQYFKNIGSVEVAINVLRPYLKEDGKIIVADVVDDNTSSMLDAGALLIQCLKRGRMKTFFRFMSYLLFSDYRKLAGSVSLLKVSENAINEISKNTSMNCKKIKGLTMHPSRTNYILTKAAGSIRI
jgi:2-polyprenyl-3-methyl-5-hydroxy-6-metoxy-1,4-benzoquinol methylase